MNACKWMQTLTCIMIIVWMAANAAVSILASGPGHKGGIGSTKQRLKHLFKSDPCKSTVTVPRLSHSEVCIITVWSVNSTVYKHSDEFVRKNTSERVA